jgi:hypothetical protein
MSWPRTTYAGEVPLTATLMKREPDSYTAEAMY